MTPEEKSLLERTYALAQENNAMLLSIKRTGRITIILRIVYWVVIIGFSFGALYFIQPYLSSLLTIYGGGAGGSMDINKVQDAANQLKDLFK
jgi:hypothetical protein